MLAAGLSIGALVYFSAGEPDTTLQEMYGSKLYVRDLQRFGGKAAVLFDELDRWFAGLWEGKTLGLTIAFGAATVSAVLLLLANRKDD